MEKFYERYWKEKEGHLSDFNLKWPIISSHIPTREDVVILDFGCGKGEIIKEMKKINAKARYIGVDVSEEGLKKAKENVSDATFSLISDGGIIPLEKESVDFVFSSEVIEHVYDTENAIKEIARVLKPGGSVLMTTPFHGFLKNIAIVFFGFDKHFDPIGSHIRFFSKKTLSDLFFRYGLIPSQYKYYGRFYPFSHSIVIIAQKER